MNLPWKAGASLGRDEYQRVRREAIFRYHKWDQQVGDVATLCPFPLIVRRAAWNEVAALAEILAEETRMLETELAERPETWSELGLPAAIVRVMRDKTALAPGKARLIRFDFHFTPEGWKISEANTDVPGGWNEATGYPVLLAPFYPGNEPVAKFADGYAQALAENLEPGAAIALVHATAYTDDRQAMVFLAEKLTGLGVRPCLVSPEQIEWKDGRAHIQTDSRREPVGLIVRYFPGEWLPNLRRQSGWPHFFRSSLTPISNPAMALLSQSKRLPLIWDRLSTRLPAWRKLLPECAEPDAVPWETDASWIVKPALGRVGSGIGLRECLPAREWDEIHKQARTRPGHWVAQKRFHALALSSPEGEVYPCLGVYTIDGRVAGAYGRLAPRPLIDHQARDVAILISDPS